MDNMTANDLFDIDGFLARYADADFSELRQVRNRLLTKHWEYQNSDNLLDDAQFADALEIKIELALLDKLIWLNQLENK